MATLSQNLKKDSYQAAIDRFDKVKKPIQKVQSDLAQGVANMSKYNDNAQCTLYENRERQLAEQSRRRHKGDVKNNVLGYERKIGQSKDILSIEFFEAGLLAARPVGYISVNFGMEEGTGVLVGNGLLLTNHHVIRDVDTAESSSVEFNKEGNRYGEPKRVEQFDFAPGRFFLTNKTLDFTIVAIDEQSGSRPLSQFGYHPLIPRRGKVRIGDAVNIIQHPLGQEKSVVVHNSNLLHMENGSDLEPFLWYSSDTEPGSSGSPVFNNRWEVIALHHRAVPSTDNVGRILSVKGNPLSDKKIDSDREQIWWVANEGVRASVIVEAVRRATFTNEHMRKDRNELVRLWESTLSGMEGAESSMNDSQHAETPSTDGTAVTVNIQLNVKK